MAAREGVLFGMGNPLLDISATCDLAFLNKYDLQPNNAIIAEKEKHGPMYKEMVHNLEVDFIPGGATQNSIKIAQWLLKTPNATTYMGCIGNDDFGKILEEKTKAIGVNTRYQKDKEEPTGTCAVLLTDNNRSLCAYLAAANHFKHEHLDDEENWGLVKSAEFYYISGFFLTVSPDSINSVGKHAGENKKTFMMNLSAPFLCQFFKEKLMAALPYVDILFGNETEAETFAKEQDFKTTDIKEIALKTADLPKEHQEKKRMVVFTQGSEATIVAYNGKVTEYPVIPLAQDKIVDTNGAGDAFVGGFLAQLVLGKSTEECVRCGHYCANLIIQRSGCTFPEEPDYE